LGCGARDKQKGLIRIVVRSEGALQLVGQNQGRGGYLHKAEECWGAFLRRKKMYQAFHREVTRESREKLIVALRNRYLGEKDG
jgi:predicted RNA-binding protein YlxR (DUF448 family)